MNLTQRERLSELLLMQLDATDLNAGEAREFEALARELRLDVLTEKHRLGTLAPEQHGELRHMALRMLDQGLSLIERLHAIAEKGTS